MQTTILKFFTKKPNNTDNNNIAEPLVEVQTVNHDNNTNMNGNEANESNNAILVHNNSNVESFQQPEDSSDSEDAPIIQKSRYKRLRLLSDDEGIPNENTEPIISTKKIKISQIASFESPIKGDCNVTKIGFKNVCESTPKKSKPVKEEKKMSQSTKAMLASFSKTANESNLELNESQVLENQCPNEGQHYDHFSFEFLKKENIRDIQKRRPEHPDYDPRTLFIPEPFMAKLTPAMKQWWKIKCNGNMETILLFKVGKFYELYHMDAVVAINELGISSMRGSYAHSGFPEIAFSKMTDQLVLKGYKVARVEQTETVDAMSERVKHESSKNKVVKREVCQIITPGTRGFSLRNRTCRESGQDGSEEMGYIEDAGGLLYAFKEVVLEDNSRNKMRHTVTIGVALVNTNLGKFTISQFNDDDQRSRFRTLISRYPPNEIIYMKGNLSKQTQQVFNSCLAAVTKEGLVNNKQFFSSDDTLSKLLECEYFTETPTDKLSRFGLPVGLSIALNENDNLGRSASKDYELAVSCIGALIYYLNRCLIDKYLISIADFNIYIPVDGYSSNVLEQPKDRLFYDYQSNMILDSNTLSNLDLLRNNSIGGIDGTLLERLDFSYTAFGRRLLTQWIAAPLCNPKMIIERQEAITELIEMDAKLSPIKGYLKSLPDLEKLVAKIHVLGMNKSVVDHPDSRAVLYEGLIYSRRKIYDFVTTVAAFDNVIKCQRKFAELNSERRIRSNLLTKILLKSTDIGEFPDIEDTINFFKKAFDHEKAKKEGKIVPEKDVDSDFDSAVASIEEIESDLKLYLEKQKRIMNCNITYFGTGKNRFQLEIPEAKCRNVPESYVTSSQRKGFKRYTTNETENFLAKLTNAEERRDVALKNIMSKIFAKFDEHYLQWSQVIKAIAQFDALLSLTTFSKGLDGGPMTRPEIREVKPNEQPFVVITEGRYPCKAKTQTGEFISNTVKLGSFLPNSKFKNEFPVMLLTGPNMGGKSTLMRQTALIIILSQLGCYVPAEGPVLLTPVDRLFTRQGANDSISSGQSTLQVEMNETALILAYMTKHSFLLIDELGRGTATYDGCALAYSILKTISNNMLPRTIFSTHFHKLLEEKEITKSLQISHMACMVEDDNDSVLDNNLKIQNITFLYKLTSGGCPKSYGFNAARLANIPEKIILNGLNKARLFEEENLILEFKKFLSCKSGGIEDMKLWQNRFRKIYNK